MPVFLELPQVASTNTYVKQHADELPDGALVHTPSQSAGRGQKGNSWESELGKNLTFSLLIKRPQVDVKRQFVLSEAVSLAIVETLAPLASLTIKWPNDIYAGDRKLAGILIEHLYRHDGHPHRFIHPGDETPFEATIVDIGRDGMLTLRHADTTLHRYAFKEVAFQI